MNNYDEASEIAEHYDMVAAARIAHTAVADQGIFGGEAPTEDAVNDVLRRIAEGEDAKRELSILKPTLAYALSKLEKKQLRVRAEDMPTLGDRFDMQAKSDGHGGIILRSVKTTREVNGL